MIKTRKFKLFFWHKLLMALGSAMIVLSFGLTFTAMMHMRRASTQIGIKGKDILANQTERFLTSIVTGQADTVDLQLDQARIAAIHGAAVLKHQLSAHGIMSSVQFFADLMANAGSFSTTIYYAALDGRVAFFTPASQDNVSDRLQYSSIAAYHFSDFADTPNPRIPMHWSDVHRNPYSMPYDRVVDALAPVYANGRLAGYLGVSVSVIKLVSQFNSSQTIRGSYTFILDEDMGLVFGPPHATFELSPAGSRQRRRGVLDLGPTQNQELESVLNDMAMGNSAVQRIHINGRPKYMAYRPLGRTNWSLGLAVPEALATVASGEMVRVIEDTGKQAFTRMVLATLFFLGGALVVVGLITRRLTQPLLEMADAADRVARGELERQIEITSTDEIGELAQAFNTMTLQLRQYIDSIDRQRQELFESEARYRALFEKSPISLWEEDFSRAKRYLDDIRNAGVTDLEDYFTKHPEKVVHCIKLIRIVDVNEATMRMYAAKSKSELLGSLPKVLTEESQDVLKQELVAMSEGRMLEIECANKTLDGRRLTVVLRALVPPGYEKTWRKVFVAINDITARSKAEKEKKQLEVQLRQAYKMEAIGTLAGGVAHDFNNILSAIIGYTELLKNMPDLGEKKHRYIQQIMKAALRAKDLVKQILAFSRQTEQATTPVSLKCVTVDALKLLRASLPTTIDIHQELHSDGVVMADVTQIHQVLINLCTNAGQSMQEDGGVLTLRLNDITLDHEMQTRASRLPAGAYLKLQIEDTGTGMSEDTMERIFDPFFTTKDRHQGTGMGLAMVHGIIKSYSGHIDVQSTLGKGSIFDVYLPLAEVPELPPQTPPETDLPHGDESILFVDDEDALVELGAEMLGRVGYRVTTHTSSLNALAALKKDPHAFDLVITDMTMPHMTGDRLARAIRAIDAHIPIIVCSGFSERLDRLTANERIDAFLMKPLDMSDLVTTVRNLLDDRNPEVDP